MIKPLLALAEKHAALHTENQTPGHDKQQLFPKLLTGFTYRAPLEDIMRDEAGVAMHKRIKVRGWGCGWG